MSYHFSPSQPQASLPPRAASWRQRACALLGLVATLALGFAHAQERATAANLIVDPIIAFEDYFQQTLVPQVPGAALVLVVDGQVRLLKGYGVREIGAPLPVTPETVFRLGSVSKTLASTAAGLLVEQQRLEWGSELLSHLDELQFKNPEYGRLITLQNVLSHSSGLIPHAYTNLVEDGLPYETIVKRLREVDFVCPPGKCYGYQNVLFSLVGDVVRATTGTSYEDFVSSHLFEPLAMQQASFGLKAYVDAQDHATPHVWNGARWVPVQVKPTYYRIAPAAGANASIQDMAQWLLAQMGLRQDVLPMPLLAQLHAKTIPTSGRQAQYRRRPGIANVHYGLGWRVFDYRGEEGFVHHGGWVAGSRAEMVFHPRLRMGMVLLTNSEARDLDDLLFKFIDLYQESRELRRVQASQTLQLQTEPAG